jgi:hypothetical protein
VRLNIEEAKNQIPGKPACLNPPGLVVDIPLKVSVMAVENLWVTEEGPSRTPQQNISTTKLRGL